MINQRSQGMAILRIMMGFMMLKDFIIYFINREALFGKSGIVPYDFYQKIIKVYHLNFLNYPFSQFSSLFCIIGVALSFCFLSNYKTLICGTILFFMVHIIRFRNIFILDGADNLVWIMLPFVTLYTPNLFFKNRAINTVRRYLNLLLPWAVMIQMCIVYSTAALYKLEGELWKNGTALFYILRVDEFRPSNLNVWLTQYKVFVIGLTYLTIAWEGLFPFFAFFRRTKYYLFALSLLMHIGIFICMRIDNYSYIIIAAYIVFFTNSEIESFMLKFKKINILRYAKPSHTL